MRAITTFLLLIYISNVLGKNNVKSLTESMGQEIIEVVSPIKDLPPGFEEEPSPDDEDEKPPATVLATKKDVKKTMVVTTASRKPNITISSIDDEESRIEKELAAIYKDNDYKSENSEEKTDKPEDKTNVPEVTPDFPETEDNKIIGRQQSRRNDFKFEPPSDSKQDIEKFRTSVDDISCGKLSHALTEKQTNKALRSTYLYGIINTCVLLTIAAM